MEDTSLFGGTLEVHGDFYTNFCNALESAIGYEGEEMGDRQISISNGRTVPQGTVTTIERSGVNDKLNFYTDDGFNVFSKTLPHVVEVKVHNDKAITLSFADGTKQTSVLKDDGDSVLVAGITICYLKKLLSCGAEVVRNAGNNSYNKILENIFKLMEQQKKDAEFYKESVEKQKVLNRKKQEKKRKKAEKRRKKLADAICCAFETTKLNK